MDKCAKLQDEIIVNRPLILANANFTALRGYTELLSAPKPDKSLAAASK
jgi:hypothetical protein